MHTLRSIATRRRMILIPIVLCAGSLIGVSSCNFSGQPNFSLSDPNLGWPATALSWRPTTELPANWQEGKILWQPKSYTSVKVDLPQVPGATLTELDASCVICHETYVTAFANNVHRKQGCEACHGAASKHLETRGTGAASILSLNPNEEMTASGRATTPAERAEICLQCHETQPVELGATWRTSAHAHQKVTCSDCHVAHYNVPPGTPAVELGANDPSHQRDQTRLAQWSPTEDSLRGTSQSLGAATPESCYPCHGALKRFEEAGQPHQIGAPIGRVAGGTVSAEGDESGTFGCTTCHNPHGNVTAETRKALCLQCHQGPSMDEWHGSPHDLAGIGCTDCHQPHPETGLSMSVDQPGVCYRCHSQTRQLEELAGPHQLLGPNAFNCSTCHRPHGRVTQDTRTDLCLRCHTGTPTMGWHSSYHWRAGVACADCHDAHPDSQVPREVGLYHTHVYRPNRRPMTVNEPATCYNCHPKIFGMASLPSHHPIREGKMRCSDCHDSHGQDYGSLKAPTLNQLCYECHAEKEGPFVWEHAPVTESCAILPRAARHRGQQSAPPTNNVSVLALPRRPLHTRWLAAMHSMPLGG